MLIVFLCALILPTQSLHSAEQRARLELKVDEKRFSAINVFFRGDDIMTRLVDLDGTGIRSAGGRVETIHSEKYISLKSLVGISPNSAGDFAGLRPPISLIAAGVRSEATLEFFCHSLRLV